jgi:hypothetical protein
MRKEYDFSKAKLVIPPKDPKKTRITIRLDTKILDWFRKQVHEAGGGNYQTLINEVLKSYIESDKSRTIQYPGGPYSDLDEKYQKEFEAEGLKFKGRGYDFRNNTRDLEAA